MTYRQTSSVFPPVPPVNSCNGSAIDASDSASILQVSEAKPDVTLLIEDLCHDLCQPLSVIEALAYRLQITSNDHEASAQLEKIQDMVLEASHILEKAKGSVPAVVDESAQNR